MEPAKTILGINRNKNKIILYINVL